MRLKTFDAHNTIKTLTVFAIAILAAFAFLLVSAEESHAATHDSHKVKWTQKSGSFYCKVDGKRQANGIEVIKGKSYLFSKNGAQKTGWRKVGGKYYYFKPENKAAGYMVKNKVVNGVRLSPNGSAILNSETKKEMVALTEAQDFLDKYTKPAWPDSKKLRKSFRVLVKDYSERLWHKFSHSKGWARREALDLFQKKSGPCYAYGAAFAYIASAIGYKDCQAVSSGGHGWAEVDNKIYDPEWTKHQSIWLYAIPKTRSGRGGVQSYAKAGYYRVSINPRTKEIGGKKISKSTWTTVNGARYYFKSDGKMATGPTKVKGKWYVFKADGKLATGKKDHIVKINGKKYQVSKTGRAKSGWNKTKTMYSNKKGLLLSGNSVISGKIYSFTTKGVLDKGKTQKLQSACIVERDAGPLLALLGKPTRSLYSPSCNQVKDERGVWLTGDDGILKYPNFTVYTFRGTDGIVRFMGVSSK